MDDAGDRSLVFTNFVDFDSTYGHRRNVEGYGEGLMLIDRRLPELWAKLQPGDLVLVTADHGCDPTWTGSDHTREHVPALFFGPEVLPGALKPMETYLTWPEFVAQHLGLTLKRGTAQKVVK